MDRCILHVDVNNAFLSWTAVDMLKNGENYNSDLYKKSDVLPTTRETTVEQAILMAQFQGYRIKSATE